jgi:hypothetical protein
MGLGAKYIEDDFLNIARGNVKGVTSIHKFGAVPAMSINTTGTIWDVSNTVYPWSAFNTPGVLTIPAVNAADNGHRVKVFGLDANFNLTEEDFTLSSSVTVTGTKVFSRVYRHSTWWYYGSTYYCWQGSNTNVSLYSTCWLYWLFNARYCFDSIRWRCHD